MCVFIQIIASSQIMRIFVYNEREELFAAMLALFSIVYIRKSFDMFRLCRKQKKYEWEEHDWKYDEKKLRKLRKTLFLFHFSH